jgi:hypothetical protein
MGVGRVAARTRMLQRKAGHHAGDYRWQRLATRARRWRRALGLGAAAGDR